MATSILDVPLQPMRDVLRAHGVVRAAYFGSFARGAVNEKSDNEKSDVDILVEFGRAVSLFDMASLDLDLSDLLGRSVEIVTYRALNPHIRKQVLREQVSIL